MRVFGTSPSGGRAPMGRLGRITAALVALLVAITWAEVAHELWARWDTYRIAVNVRESNKTASALLEAGQNLAFERGRTNVMLNGAGPAPEADRAFIAARRKVASDILEPLLANLADTDGLIAATRNDLAGLNRLRQQVDEALVLPRSGRPPQLADRWFAEATATVRSLGNLAASQTLTRETLTSRFRVLSRLRILAYELRDAEGTAASRIAAIISSGGPIDPVTIDQVMRQRGQTAAIWAALQREHRALANPAIAGAAVAVEVELFARFRPLQDQMLAAARDGRPFPAPLSQLTAASVPALDAIARLMTVIATETAAAAETDRSEAQWALLGHGILAVAMLVLGCGVLHLILTRLLHPLATIQQQVERLTAGQLGTPLAQPGHDDELGHMAKAVIAFRDSLLERRRMAEQLQEKVAALNHEAAHRRDAQLAHQDSEIRFRHAMDHAPIGMAIIAADGTWIAVNPAMCAIFGKTESVLLGAGFGALVGDGSLEEDLSMVRGLARGLAKSWRDERQFRLADGERGWIRINAAPIGNDNGKPVQVILQVEDISDTRRLRTALAEKIAELNTILDNSSVGIALVRDRVQVWTNRKMAELFGYTPHEMAGLETRDLYASPEDYERVGVMGYHTLSAGGIFSTELEMRRRDGSLRWMRMSGRAILDGRKASGSIWVVEDISAHKRMELELTRSNSELEHFAYVASHDLRQPLRMVSSFLTLLGRKLEGRLDDEEQSFIAFAVDGARRMDRTITDLLDYSRIGRGGGEKAEVPMTRVMEMVRHHLAHLMDEAGAEVITDPDLPVIRGYESELVRLLQNLVTNAIKYRHPDRAPVIRITARATADEWQFAIADNGIGISPADQGKLFTLFQRLGAAAAQDGNGIGLAACRKICEHHGGRIWIDSELGVGSTFHVGLPK